MGSQKRDYDVLEIVPKWEITKIYLRCLLANFTILLKWLYESVKCKVNPTAIMRRTIERTDFPNKPPIFMTDTNLGRHSYVKLEVMCPLRELAPGVTLLSFMCFFLYS